MMNVKPLTIEICPVSVAARVTAGLTWPPEMIAVMYTTSTTVSVGVGYQSCMVLEGKFALLHQTCKAHLIQN